MGDGDHPDDDSSENAAAKSRHMAGRREGPLRRVITHLTNPTRPCYGWSHV